jgi:hypothetical protein
VEKRRETARERRRRLRATARSVGAAPVPSASVSGELRILNTGAGDVRISFRPDASADEKNQARELIEKMLREGYALLVQTPDGSYARAKGFDPETHSYILSTAPPKTAEVVDEMVDDVPKRKRGRPRKVTTAMVPAMKAKAVAVARSAGG